MSKVWKEVRISVCGVEQTVAIYPDLETDEGTILMQSIEENDRSKDFLLYMTPEEAEVVADELKRFAQEAKSERLNIKE